MKRLFVLLASVWCGVFLTVGVAGAQKTTAKPPAKPAVAPGWTIPAGAAKEKNPLPAGEATLTAGKALFAKQCTRCHGDTGMGDGPDADHHHADHMNLTLAAGAAKNPDGVIFYRIWNGRTNPKMPAFKDKLTKEQAWAIVAYVQTLRLKK